VLCVVRWRSVCCECCVFCGGVMFFVSVVFCEVEVCLFCVFVCCEVVCLFCVFVVCEVDFCLL
jgi:hypothetical protein